MNRLFFSAIALLAPISRADAEAPLNYRVAAPGLSVVLDEQGRIAGCSAVKVAGQTWLDGCQTVARWR